MYSTIRFGTFKECFENLDIGNILNESLRKQFYDFLPNLFNYEEEGEKLNFDILFIKDIEKNRKLLPSFIFQEIVKQNIDKFNFKKFIKSIAPFSKNGWNLFISTNDSYITIGVYKNLNGITAIDISSILTSEDFFQLERVDNSKLLFFNSDEKFVLHISVIEEEYEFNRKDNIKKLVELFTKGISHDSKHKFIENISNVLFHNFDKIHGTIICIQDKNTLVDSFLQKGIFFDKPINIFEEYLNFISNCSFSENIAERYYSFVGILGVIINIDGLTLINTNGEILGYNIFIDNKDVDTSTVTGGARKRAAYSLEHSDIKGLAGVYFQSHDGDNYFKELSYE
ncbi:hypothetical protein [Aliarcobacter butzleri]|uniref:hypothetical protein n=1 Tax=Aliarcobacter butzleri TaxID=28197 RepID=UPI003B216EE5